MEKYLRGLEENLYNQGGASKILNADSNFDGNNNQPEYFIDAHGETRPQLSKWLESAAKFTPSKNNYIEWCARNKVDQQRDDEEQSIQLEIHQREEIEAAEALTKLALNFKSRYSR